MKVTAKKSVFFFTSILLISTKIFATPTITSVTGVSYFEKSSGTTTATAYGGVAGTCTTTSTTSTCNSCVNSTTPITACNPQSIHSGLVITVSYTSSVAVSNVAVKLLSESGTAATLTSLKDSTATIAAGGSGSLTTTWGALCTLDGLNADCSPSSGDISNFLNSSRGLTIWIDENGNGSQESTELARVPIQYQWISTSGTYTIDYNKQTYSSASTPGCDASAKGMCGFTLKAGDSKFYADKFIITDVSGSPAVDSGAPPWLGVAFFSIPGAAVTPASVTSAGSPVIKPYDTSSSGTISYGIKNSNLDGFTNYTRYCFVMGNINKAYNIYRFNTVSADATLTCGSPSEVVGVLDDKHCFISTAAFGSDMAPEVETFRQFRNQFLLSNGPGKEFVKLYYKYSPPVANFISSNEMLRSATRGILYPLLGFSYVALNYGFLVAVLTAMVLLILAKSVLKTVFKNKKVLVTIVLLFAFNLKAEEGGRRVQHPGAAEGLIKIEKDGTYVYGTKKDLKKQSGHLYFGESNNPEVTVLIDSRDSSGAATGTKNEYNFNDFYENASKFIIGYDYEWFPWAEKTMLGVQAGVGLMYASGHGRLKAASTTEANPVSEEKFSFVTMPVNLGAVYRFQFKDTQLFVPYVAGGGTMLVLGEKREDKSTPNFTGGFGYYGAGGLLINLTSFDSETAFDLNNEYGIGNLWLTLEARVTEVDSDNFKFSTQYFNAGFAFDF